jgi:hypothetical protein
MSGSGRNWTGSNRAGKAFYETAAAGGSWNPIFRPALREGIISRLMVSMMS